MARCAAEIDCLEIRSPGVEAGQDWISISKPHRMIGMIDTNAWADTIPKLVPMRSARDHGFDIVWVARHRVGIELFHSESSIEQLVTIFDPQGIVAIVLAVEAEVQAVAVVPDSLHCFLDLINADFRDREEKKCARILFVILEGFVEQARESPSAGFYGA